MTKQRAKKRRLAKKIERTIDKPLLIDVVGKKHKSLKVQTKELAVKGLQMVEDKEIIQPTEQCPSKGEVTEVIEIGKANVLIHETKQYCLFFSLLNSLVGVTEKQKALTYGSQPGKVKEAVQWWDKVAMSHVEVLEAQLASKGIKLDAIKRSNVGYRARDVYSYLKCLKADGIVHAFRYERTMTDGHYGPGIGLFAMQKDRMLKNRRLILHGVAANGIWVKETAGQLLGGNKRKGKGKKRNTRTIEDNGSAHNAIDNEQHNIDKMITFTSRVNKAGSLESYERCLTEGRYKACEKYPFSAHAICVVFDQEGKGWIGDPAKLVWKELTFKNYIESLVWTYSAYDFDLIVV